MARNATLASLADVASNLEATSSRLEKRRILVEFLRDLGEEEVGPAVLLLTGKVLPETEEAALNVGWATLQKALKATDQATLVERDLTLLRVHETLRRVARAQGKDSVRKKQRLLQSLFSQASEAERDLLLRSLSGEVRIGAYEGVILEALADATGADPEVVRRAHMFLGDLGETARLALTEGEPALARQRIRLFTPIRPMMAEMAEDLTETFRELGPDRVLEFKLDGARIQIHRKGGRVRVFSRRLTEVTESLPEVIERAETFGGGDLLLEGEVVAVDPEGRPLPFQDLMRRFRRVHDVETLAEEIPLQLVLFDALVVDGTPRIDEPYTDRWEALAEAVPDDLLVPRRVAPSPEEAEAFLQMALEAGHEGLMAKDPASPYTPGKRGKRWLKVKPVETLDLVILAAEWGHGRRRGWLSNYHLGVRDETEGGFRMVGKTFKGLTDEEFEAMTTRLRELAVRETPYLVEVRPEVMVEVAYNEIQRSPHYDSEFALRFARITRIREDRGPDDVDTLDRLRRLYERQFRRKGRPPSAE